MLNKNSKNAKDTRNEKICSFFASDFHFEMISLPYIEKLIEEDKDVVILTENNLADTMSVLLSRTNLSEDKKKMILSLDWAQNHVDKIEKMKELANTNREITIFVKGAGKYIQTINETLENVLISDKVTIVDCYDINEIGNDLSMITSQYKNVLNTTGKIDLAKKMG